MALRSELSLVILQPYLVMGIVSQIFIIDKKVDAKYGAVVSGYIRVFNLRQI